MSDSGVFRMNPLQGWQRDAILRAAQVLRDKFGDPPADAEARAAHDGLLEVLDPARRTVRLQKELGDSTRKAQLAQTTERRLRERRGRDRRKVNIGPPPGIEERRKVDRRQGDRRQGNRRTRK